MIEKIRNYRIYAFFIPLFIGLFVLGTFLSPVIFSSPIISPSSVSLVEENQHLGIVCTQYIDCDPETGICKEPVDNGCDHNILFNAGQNITRDALFRVAQKVVQNISICNSSIGAGCGVPNAGGSEGYTAFTGCGLASKIGTVGINDVSAGNISIFTTFTSTCDNIFSNSTRLTNETGTIFLGANFGGVSINNTDQITINITISNS